jgi:hypothetical protein
MSRKSNGYDNALMESYWAMLKKKLVHRRRFRARVEAYRAIFEYIGVFYNRVRIYRPPGCLVKAWQRAGRAEKAAPRHPLLILACVWIRLPGCGL